MGVDFHVNGNITEIGASSFLHAFFSTIHFHLERGPWGSAYPTLMNSLYQGQLRSEEARAALDELDRLTPLLAQIPPSQVVRDIENRNARPPWGDNISPHITDLSNYFVTSDGKDLLTTMRELFVLMIDEGHDLQIM